jgi:hypothetical protein
MDAERTRCTGRTLGGEPCSHPARPGTTRCRVHSGRELRRAERKLQRLTIPAVDRLERALASDNDNAALKAAAMILDRVAGPVPRAVTIADQGGVPAVQIGFALGGLVQPPTIGALPMPEPVVEATPEPDAP